MYDIIGDIHGCTYELSLLLEKMGYEWDTFDGTIIYKPPDGRKAVFVGDLVDRGYSSATAYCLVRDMVRAGFALLCRGNHDDKFMRWAKGNNVILNHGLDKTTEDAGRMGLSKEGILDFLKNTPMYLSLDDGKLIVAHAAWRNSLKDKSPFDKKCRTWCLYGPTTGKTLENGLPDRIDWAAERKETEPLIVYGHQPYKEPRYLNGTYAIDTGCVFGGHLTALRYPEMEIVQIKANRTYDNSKPDISDDI